MKPTPTHPVPDLHKALKTLPLCTKRGSEWRDICTEESEVCVQFQGICGTPGHTFAVYLLTENFKHYIMSCFKCSSSRICKCCVLFNIFEFSPSVSFHLVSAIFHY